MPRIRSMPIQDQNAVNNDPVPHGRRKAMRFQPVIAQHDLLMVNVPGVNEPIQTQQFAESSISLFEYNNSLAEAKINYGKRPNELKFH